VAAYREALKERTKDVAFRWRDMARATGKCDDSGAMRFSDR
jgi:hypothetical protein